MADPSYIVDGVLTDSEAWVPIQSIEPTANFEWASTDDGQVGDWSQYMDLKVIGYFRTSQLSVNINLTMNFNNTSDYFSYQIFRGDGTNDTALSGSIAGRWDPCEGAGASATANVFAGVVIDIFDINSGKYKSSIATGASGDHTGTHSYATLHASTWKSQAPITAIDFYSRSGGTFVTGSRFDLFGILPRMVA
jgi:hypothetical protein